MTSPPGERSGSPVLERQAVLFVILAAFGFALISIFTVLATREGTPLTTILLGRYLVASLVLLPALRAVASRTADGGDLVRVFVIGGVGQGIVAALSLSALAYIPVATLVFLFYTYPAWVTLFAVVRGLEPLGRRTIVALGLSLGGLVLLVGLPGAAAIHPTGVALALSAAVAYAVYIPLLRVLQRGLDPALTSLMITMGVSLIFLAAGAARGELALDLPARSWAAIVSLGVFCTAIAFRLFLKGLAALGSVRTAIVSTVEPLFAAGLGALVLDQAITLPVVAGGAMILGAVVVLQWKGPPS